MSVHNCTGICIHVWGCVDTLVWQLGSLDFGTGRLSPEGVLKKQGIGAGELVWLSGWARLALSISRTLQSCFLQNWELMSSGIQNRSVWLIIHWALFTTITTTKNSISPPQTTLVVGPLAWSSLFIQCLWQAWCRGSAAASLSSS